MSDQPTQEVEPQGDAQVPAQLREAAERGRQASRELAFVKAGIDTDSPAGQMFMASYQGELERDAITASWGAITAQFASSTPPPAPASEPTLPPGPTAEELERQRMIADLSHDSVPPDQQVPADPVEEGYQAFYGAMGTGATREEASAHISQRLVDAAVKGDQRAIWNGWSEEELAAARAADGTPR